MNTVVNFVPTIVAGVKTMNSKDIAEYTGKTHGHIIRDIREMLNKLAEPELVPVNSTTDFYQENFLANKATASFDLDEELTLTLVSGYDVVMRKRIINAWKIAEEALKEPKFEVLDTSTHIKAQLAYHRTELKLLETNLLLEERNAEIASVQPMIAFHEAVVADDKVYKLAEAAKILGIAPQKFNTYLRDEKYLMRNLVPYERWIKQGVFESGFAGYVKPDGTTAPATTYVSSKGLAYLQKKLAE